MPKTRHAAKKERAVENVCKYKQHLRRDQYNRRSDSRLCILHFFGVLRHRGVCAVQYYRFRNRSLYAQKYGKGRAHQNERGQDFYRRPRDREARRFHLGGGGGFERVREILKISQDPVSLETPIGEEDDSHLGDFVKDINAMTPEEYATNEILKEEIKAVLETLQEREQEVLELRFGLIDGTSHTLEEVGKRFNVTRERIRQIEAKALRKLRHPSRAKRLKDFLTD